MYKRELEVMANNIRKGVIKAIYNAQSGHPGGSLSAADILTYLYFKEMNIDPQNPMNPQRDRFVLSKGHVAPGLYSTLAHRGYFPVEDLRTLRQVGSYLQGHPDMKHIPGVDMSTGSLGQGLSAAVASTFAMFAAGRAFEQIRNSIGYTKLNVKIGATHAGISVGEDGATHQCNEDIALMRTIPGMVIINPSDDIEAKAAVRAAYLHKGPCYMRFGRLPVSVINDNADYTFELGKGVVLQEGTDVTIIATGICVSEALLASALLKEDGISAQVINIHTIKPLDEKLIIAAAQKTRKVVTIEEHSIIGGLGSAICETLCTNYPIPVMRIGINDTYGESGPAKELIKLYGLDSQNIYKKVKAMFFLD